MDASVTMPDRASACAEGEGVVADALRRLEALGTREFFISPGDLAGLLRLVLRDVPRPILSLNRPHADGRSMVHRVEWAGLVFICVSPRPLMVG